MLVRATRHRARLRQLELNSHFAPSPPLLCARLSTSPALSTGSSGNRLSLEAARFERQANSRLQRQSQEQEKGLKVQDNAKADSPRTGDMPSSSKLPRPPRRIPVVRAGSLASHMLPGSEEVPSPPAQPRVRHPYQPVPIVLRPSRGPGSPTETSRPPDQSSGGEPDVGVVSIRPAGSQTFWKELRTEQEEEAVMRAALERAEARLEEKSLRTATRKAERGSAEKREPGRKPGRTASYGMKSEASARPNNKAASYARFGPKGEATKVARPTSYGMRSEASKAGPVKHRPPSQTQSAQRAVEATSSPTALDIAAGTRPSASTPEAAGDLSRPSTCTPQTAEGVTNPVLIKNYRISPVDTGFFGKTNRRRPPSSYLTPLFHVVVFSSPAGEHVTAGALGRKVFPKDSTFHPDHPQNKRNRRIRARLERAINAGVELPHLVDTPSGVPQPPIARVQITTSKNLVSKVAFERNHVLRRFRKAFDVAINRSAAGAGALSLDHIYHFRLLGAVYNAPWTELLDAIVRSVNAARDDILGDRTSRWKQVHVNVSAGKPGDSSSARTAYQPRFHSVKPSTRRSKPSVSANSAGHVSPSPPKRLAHKPSASPLKRTHSLDSTSAAGGAAEKHHELPLANAPPAAVVDAQEAPPSPQSPTQSVAAFSSPNEGRQTADPSPDADPAAATTTTSALEAAGPTTEPAKRRGRPRKTPLSETAAEPTTEPVKRLGRPKKTPVSETAAEPTTEPVKRRGRPRKIPLSETTPKSSTSAGTGVASVDTASVDAV